MCIIHATVAVVAVAATAVGTAGGVIFKSQVLDAIQRVKFTLGIAKRCPKTGEKICRCARKPD